jgi:N-acetylglutamate synthase/N-acetylornithine aminotransferase
MNLHCVIMTFNPNSSREVVEVDVNIANETLVKSMDTPSRANWGKIKNSYGTSKGEFAILEAAPLVYPHP